jgi:hypothetical protein
MNEQAGRSKPRKRLAAHWADLPAILPAALLQACSIGLVIGVASGGLIGWLMFDAFWVGTLAVATPLSLIFLVLLLRTGLVDD